MEVFFPLAVLRHWWEWVSKEVRKLCRAMIRCRYRSVLQLIFTIFWCECCCFNIWWFLIEKQSTKQHCFRNTLWLKYVCEFICKSNVAFRSWNIAEYPPVSESLGVPVMLASTYMLKLCYFYKEQGGKQLFLPSQWLIILYCGRSHTP